MDWIIYNYILSKIAYFKYLFKEYFILKYIFELVFELLSKNIKKQFFTNL